MLLVLFAVIVYSATSLFFSFFSAGDAGSVAKFAGCVKLSVVELNYSIKMGASKLVWVFDR